jgi:hypothetical protein
MQGFPVSIARPTPIGSDFIGPYDMQVGVQPNFACSHLYGDRG